tara:strand:+ start:1467 stop:3404 length:1938 start_codon:yes stop_codon:yes gene_type:complete
MPNNSNNIFFSVVIPTRNRPADFKKALESLLSQTFTAFEIIVVNDGTNSTYRAAYNNLEAEFPSVTFINLIERTRGHGHCFARNQGVDIAKGKFICFLDDDDWWTDNEFLERAAENIEKFKADFYFANQKAITHEGTNVPNVWVENLPETLPDNDPRQSQTVFSVSVTELLKATGFPHQNCWAIATKLYNEIGGMDENLRYEPDRDIYLRAIDNAESILYDKTVMSLHNIPDKTKSTNASTKTNVLEKLLFQLRTVEKSILFGKKQEIRRFCITRKGYILKTITETLVAEKKHKLAFLYAKEALAVSFTFKWLLFTTWCAIKSITNYATRLKKIKTKAKTSIASCYHETTIGKQLLSPIKTLLDNKEFNDISDREFIIERFFTVFNIQPNLETPITFNEKLQWLKLNDRTPLHTTCADKLAVRKIIKKEIGEQYLIPLLLETKNVTDINPNNLPEAPFVIKTNHDSGNVFIVTDKSQVHYEHIRHKLKHSLRHNYYHTSREWQYKKIQPTIIVERLISDNYGKVPKDYKIHCFNGEPEFIQVDSDRFQSHRRTIYNLLWQEQDYAYKYQPLSDIEQPKHLDKMLELARKLAKPFPFARIDFYDTGEQLYFGEITFHPESGFGSFIPNKWDTILGEKMRLVKTGSY